MNRARMPQPNEEPDSHRPPEAFWGPVKLRDGRGVLRDAVEPAALPGSVETPGECPICAGRSLRLLGIFYGYPVHQCLSCDVGFVWPVPGDELLKEYYGPQYWAEYMNDDRPLYERKELCSKVHARQADCLDRLLAGNRQARILDVGAGDGTMLRLMQDRGYRHLLGLDVNAVNCQRAHDLLGVTVRQHDFLQYEETGWDAITLWAVIEHLVRPGDFVSQAFKLLKPGGKFVLMTGDNHSICARLQGCFDMWLYPPEHLFFFGRRSLLHLLKQAGFRQTGVRVGYQHAFKEAVLTAMRIATALKDRFLSSNPPRWRSTASNLLVAWGEK